MLHKYFVLDNREQDLSYTECTAGATVEQQQEQTAAGNSEVKDCCCLSCTKPQCTPMSDGRQAPMATTTVADPSSMSCVFPALPNDTFIYSRLPKVWSFLLWALWLSDTSPGSAVQHEQTKLHSEASWSSLDINTETFTFTTAYMLHDKSNFSAVRSQDTQGGISYCTCCLSLWVQLRWSSYVKMNVMQLEVNAYTA